ncbi:MAG TPA: HipA domain-containing protein [Jiangellaceae bacterium]
MTAADLRAIDAADVYKAGLHAGQLLRHDDDVIFRYDPGYRDDPSTPPVAWTLPKDVPEVRASGGSVPPFFAGLLPEGVRLRAVVAGTRTSEDDHFTLLLAVGNDTIGDVRIAPAGVAPTEPEPAFDPTSTEQIDLQDLFDRVAGPELLTFDAVALPGVQPKVSAAMLSSPVTTTHGPAILKLNPPSGFPRLVENEQFFLQMARDCELRVPDHLLIHDRAGRAGLLVMRFDRLVGPDGAISRLAQEDACQVLGVYPARKYRIKTEEAIERLALCCELGHGSRQVEVLRMIHLVAFSYLIGNGDLHGKNISIRASPEGRWETTPAYDLVTTQPYMRWRDPMALDFHGRANKLNRAHLVAASTRLGIAERAVVRLLDRLCSRARPWADRVAEIGFEPRQNDLLHELIIDRINELS